jgi:hypothetical protein
MNTTILNYPGFQTLPKEIKQLLVASEAHYFDQPASFHRNQREDGPPQRLGHASRRVLACPSKSQEGQHKAEMLLDVLRWTTAYVIEAKSELGKSANEVIDLIKMIEQKLCPKLE